MGQSAENLFKTPEQVKQERSKQLQTLFASTQSPYEGMGAALGVLLTKALGVKDPALERASNWKTIYNEVLQNNPDINSPEFYNELANKFSAAGLTQEANYALQEARKYQKENIELGMKQAKASREIQEAAQRNVKFYKENPDQAEFKLTELAEIIKNDPGNQQALAQYNQITRAASEGSIEATQKAEKESIGLEKDKAQLAKYRKDLADAQKFGPAERWQAEKQAALNLLKSYNIDPTKPLNQQTPPIPSSILYGPMGGEITNAYERAVRPDIGEPMSSPPATPAKAGGSSNLEAQVKASGIPYEPNKYEYRVLANGTVQRRAK